MTSVFDRIAQDSITIKRASPVVSNKQAGTLNTIYANIKATKCFPVDAETARRLELKSLYVVGEIFIMGDYAIENGDILENDVTGKVYNIKSVEAWPFLGTTVVRMVVEESK